MIVKEEPEFIISFGYRYIIPEQVIKAFPNKIINVHISALPWNRGADPNFWSFYDDTPKGVTIHYVDKGIDTGPIIAQELIVFDDDMTLRQTYEILVKTGWRLLYENLEGIVKGTIKSIKQTHYKKDAFEMINSLPNGWDTKVKNIRSMK
jgi:methionyl-tRNA formyltransferase